jgi:hypothetical protein
VAAILSVVAFLIVTALPGTAGASMTKTRIMERDGQIIVVSQEVGNQAFPVDWVENDARRRPDAGLELTYAIDRTELPPGISWEDTEAAVESAVATFNEVQCGKHVQLVRLDTGPDADLGVAQDLVGLGGRPETVADITFAGWVPDGFMDAMDMSGSKGLTVPAVYDAADGSVVWGYDVLNPTREYTDINDNGQSDLAAMEIYFTTAANFVIDDERGDTLFFIDLESIVLHELGHALGMDHFGRTEVILDEEGNFVDVVLNRNSTPMMNTSNYFINREVAGSDKASFCGRYGSWGKGPGAP